jgi:fucose permease
MQPTAPAPNRQRLFLASFLLLIASGMGFSARAAVLGIWGAQFGFTKADLGVITGFGLTGFGLTVILFSLLVERWGYGVLLTLTFACHILSAAVSLMAAPVFHAFGKEAAFWCLSAGMTLFALGNSAGESAINPLVAALYPEGKTNRLNMLHAGYPAGLILGAFQGVLLQGWSWEVILLAYLAPTLAYGLMMFRQGFPASQARQHNLSLKTMFTEFTSPVLLALLALMALVGFVELGTDSWISSITGNLLANPTRGLYLFIWTSSVMFVLRFCAGPIVKRISPLGLLSASACFGAVGLVLLEEAGQGFNWGGVLAAAWVAATIYGVGKTFYWGTMLGVVAERFPRGGALTLGAVGCVGTLSGGLLGGPVIGFIQDYFASQHLRESSPASYQTYRAETDNRLLLVFRNTGLDGSKVAVLQDDGRQLEKDLDILRQSGKSDAHLESLRAWWERARLEANRDREPVAAATLRGSRMALKCTAIVPAIMALGYLLLALYFRSKGGYAAVRLETSTMADPIQLELKATTDKHSAAEP